MKHYYRFEINYDEDTTVIYSSAEPLRKGDLAVVPLYGERFSVATVKEPVSALYALTNCADIDDIICTVNVSEYLNRQRVLAERMQIEKVMNMKMSELKTLDTLKKFADKDSDFKALFDMYQKTFAEKSPSWSDEEE